MQIMAHIIQILYFMDCELQNETLERKGETERMAESERESLLFFTYS